MATTVARVLEGRAQETDRPARRLRYIDTAMSPVVDRLDPDAAFKLRNALGTVLGAEAYVSLVDVCRVDPDETREILAWAAEALMRQALLEGGVDPDDI